MHESYLYPSHFVAGLLREPKWGHLRDLHKAIKQCEWALVSADPTVTSLGSNQEVKIVSLRSKFLIPLLIF